MNTYDAFAYDLTTAGAPFELCSAVVNGVEVRDFLNRPKNLAEVASSLSQYGDRPCIVYGDRRSSYADLVTDIATASACLQTDFGVTKGDRVAILSANNPEWVVSFWAITTCGGICTALNGWWKEDEIVFALRESGAKVLIADTARFNRIAARLDDLPHLDAVILTDCDSQLQLPDDNRVHRFERLVSSCAATAAPVAIGEDDDAVIIYTSGTTGRPKGAVLTHRAWIAGLMNMAFATQVAVKMYPGIDTTPDAAAILCTLPFFHVAGAHGLVLGAMAGGATLIMIQGRFDPVKAMSLIEKERVTRWSAVPTMVWRFCTHAEKYQFDLSSVKDIGYGGSPSSPRHQQLARDTFPGLKAVSNAYGLTETGSVIAMITGAEFEQRPNSVGRPFPTVDVRIANKAAKTLPAGTCGEILVKGPFLMRNYWAQSDETEHSIRGGWLHTGDIGYLDDEGFLYITDREKDIIIRGGENVSSAETESRILEHPAVAEVAVTGVAHDELGEEVKAFIRLNDGAKTSVTDIQEWVGKKLADFKVPTLIEFLRDPLPRNALGKLLKDELRSG